ncbi:MAG: branched-chain amino acid ABC transporter permease [Mycobacteriales bacterium]
MHLVIQSIANSLDTAAFLVVATLGFALVLWIDNFFNVAQAELLVIGAFIAYYTESSFHLPFLLASLVAIAGTAVLALILNLAVFRPLRHNPRVTLLVVALGVFYTLRGVLGSLIVPGVYSLTLPNLGNLRIAGAEVSWFVVVSLGLALVVLFAMYMFLGRTNIGLQARALADDPSLAVLRGVSVVKTTALVWLIVGATAGLAGVMLGIDGTLNTGLGTDQMLLIVSVAILAGVGSIFGIVATSIVTGLVLNVVGLWIPIDYAEALLFALIVAVLIFKPRGLFGVEVSRREV